MLVFDFKIREIKMLENMPVKLCLTWKRKIAWAVTCYIKLLPDNFQKKVTSLVAFDLTLKDIHVHS